MSKTSFNFQKGLTISNKYTILEFIGSGSEGEVYLIEEKKTKILRAAKFFYPTKNRHNASLKFYAKKLHKLNKCSIVISYHTEDSFDHDNKTINFIVSEYIKGVMISTYLNQFPKKQLPYYQALHIFYELVKGIQEIHALNEYHGDIHTDNIMLESFGLSPNLKIVDMYNWKNDSLAQNKKDDLYNVVAVLHEILGGKKTYKLHPQYIKDICVGLQYKRIISKFKSIAGIQKYLENIDLLSK